MAPMTVRNPVTGAEEPYFPENKRFRRIFTGCMVIIIMVSPSEVCVEIEVALTHKQDTCPDEQHQRKNSR